MRQVRSSQVAAGCVMSIFRCKDGWFGYPDCEQCECSQEGISGSDGRCDQTTGQCPCRVNFAGRQCDSCTAGYYEYPHCFSKNSVTPVGSSLNVSLRLWL